MGTAPLISIVMTAYNGEKFLRPQLDSIVQQTYKNLEIIVCDDASSDGTKEIIGDYRASDPRIKLIQQEANIGHSANLELGLRAASGRYVAISDQDDIWSLEKIESLAANIGDAAGIFSDSNLIDSDGILSGRTLLERIKESDTPANMRALGHIFKNFVSGHALLFRADLLSKLLPFADNLVFDHQIALACLANDSLKFYPTPLVRHRQHANNQVNNFDATGRDRPKPKTSTRRQGKRQILLRASEIFVRFAPDSHPLKPKMQNIIKQLTKPDDSFVNWGLLMGLFAVRNDLFYTSRNRAKKCFDLAKGRAYYDLTQRSLSPATRS